MRIALGLSAALFAISASISLAAEPAMEMDTSMGKIYADSKDMTLYTYDKDEMGKSNCYDQCAANWPPYLAAADAMAEGEWTIIDRTDGTKQWAYEGKPLYLYVDDKKPGDMMGEGKGGVWHIVKADAM
jgi:predicted lipoprotein with Yx(FWY)xxD motif